MNEQNPKLPSITLNAPKLKPANTGGFMVRVRQRPRSADLSRRRSTRRAGPPLPLS